MSRITPRYGLRVSSMPTSGSARRRARARRAAEEARAECERLASLRREQLRRDKLEQRQAHQELASYEPWGRPGGGAPNPAAIRFTNLRRRHLYPEDELKGISDVNHTTWQWPARFRKKAPLRPHEDSQLRFQDGDEHHPRRMRHRRSYKELLDELVDTRHNAIKERNKRDDEVERSLGWTDNETFNKMQADHLISKTSVVTLPEIKKTLPLSKNEEKFSKVAKLPDINARVSSDSDVPNDSKNNEHITKHEEVDHIRTKINEHKNTHPEKYSQVNEKPEEKKKDSKKPKKDTVVKRVSNGRRVKRMVAVEQEVPVIETTPESAILRMTGGVELVPLLARRRRVGARTLPSSDVTRAPEDPCEWRHMLCEEYLRELKNQMRLKYLRKEECRRDSAEDSRRHHETWAALWGRPGHGAPQPAGRHYRNNLTQLLYLAPAAHVT